MKWICLQNHIESQIEAIQEKYGSMVREPEAYPEDWSAGLEHVLTMWAADQRIEPVEPPEEDDDDEDVDPETYLQNWLNNFESELGAMRSDSWVPPKIIILKTQHQLADDSESQTVVEDDLEGFDTDATWVD